MIFNEKGKPYLIQGPPEKRRDYWDLKQVKYINFENYGTQEVQKKPVEIPKVQNKPMKMPEVVTPQKVEIKVVDKEVVRPKVEVPISEEQILKKLKGVAGSPVIYQESVSKEEYKVYARAIDQKEGFIYCDKTEFDVFFPKAGDGIRCDFINTKWNIQEALKIGSIIRLKVQ